MQSVLAAVHQYLRLNQPEKALALLLPLLSAQPNLVPAHVLAVGVYQSMGNTAKQLEHLRRGLALKPDWPEGLMLLGTITARRALLDESIAAFSALLKLQPDHVEALNNLGTVLKSAGRHEEAIEVLRRAAVIRPDSAAIRNNLGAALLEFGLIVEAVEQLRQSVALEPNQAELHAALANALLATRQTAEAIDVYRQALKLKPSLWQVQSSLLLALHYGSASDQDPTALFQEHRQFARQQASGIPVFNHFPSATNTDRRLRIGYFSSDFRQHSVANFVLPVFQNHDRECFDIVGYSDAARPDEITRQLQLSCALWREVAGLSDEELANLVRADGIDLLIDLGGHTGGARPLMFARKPAPVQITWLGYPDTTGLATMDFRISDAIADPPGADSRHSEKLLRLDPPFLVYQPPSIAPPVNELPATANGFITFGSFNNISKLSGVTVSLWAEVLKAVPKSKLLIKGRGMHNPSAVPILSEDFARLGISADRLIIEGHRTGQLAHLQQYQRVDIALDTFPYNGTTTTCEALWMGAPVVSLTGTIHAARAGASLLHSVQRPHWAAATEVEFVSIARGLSSDFNRLAEERQALRTLVQQSPLTDGVGFIRRLESAYRQAWTYFAFSQ